MKKIETIFYGSVLVLIMVLPLLLNLSINTERANEVLKEEKYTNITVHGRVWYICGLQYSTATKFTATTPLGERVSGVVCGNFFSKASAVKLF